jgi:glutamyl-tRNA reductase
MNSATSFIDSVSVCGWSAVTMGRHQVERSRQAMRSAHPGAFLVDSCQRIETYQLGTCGCESPLKLSGIAAVRHLAEVAAGLHSVVLGEAQILGQVRAARAETGGRLRTVSDIAIAAARELRRRHEFNSHAGALLDRALKAAGVAPGGRLLVIGTGQLGQLVARRGAEIGFDRVYFAGRTPSATPGPWEYLRLDRISFCPDVDVIAGCLGSAADSMTAEELPRVRSLVADLGTPMNFAGPFPVPVVTIADLLANEANRPHAVRRRKELRDELGEMVSFRVGRLDGEGALRVSQLRVSIERTRQAEVVRMLQLHPESDVASIDTFSRALVNRLFHSASEAARHSEAEFATRLLQLFEGTDRE